MANHKIGAQRYNDNMDNIFKKSEELRNRTLHGSTEKKKEIAKKMKSERDVSREANAEWKKYYPERKPHEHTPRGRKQSYFRDSKGL